LKSKLNAADANLTEGQAMTVDFEVQRHSMGLYGGFYFPSDVTTTTQPPEVAKFSKFCGKNYLLPNKPAVYYKLFFLSPNK